MANPYLSHLASRVKNDLAFLSSQGVLTTQDIQNLNAKLDQITLNQIGNQMGNLQIDAMHTGASQMSQMSSSGGGKSMCKAVWDYNKTQPDDLGFKSGDVIEVLEEVNNDWWKGSLHGQTGLFPSNHVERLPNTSNRAPPPPPHPQNNAPYNVGYNTPQQNHYSSAPPQQQTPQYPYQQPQYYGQPTPAVSEKSSYSTPPPPSHYNAPPAPPPPATQNVVVTPTAPMTEEEKKKKFPGGKFGKQVGTAFAGGMGFGAGSAITSNAINAIF